MPPSGGFTVIFGNDPYIHGQSVFRRHAAFDFAFHRSSASAPEPWLQNRGFFPELLPILPRRSQIFSFIF
jgi:hypothetical protein